MVATLIIGVAAFSVGARDDVTPVAVGRIDLVASELMFDTAVALSVLPAVPEHQWDAALVGRATQLRIAAQRYASVPAGVLHGVADAVDAIIAAPVGERRTRLSEAVTRLHAARAEF